MLDKRFFEPHAAEAVKIIPAIVACHGGGPHTSLPFAMSALPRLLLFLALAWLTLLLFHEARVTTSQPEADAGRVVLLFGAVVLVGGFTGILFVLMVMPQVGDAIGNFFFQPNQQIEKDPHADAQAAVARGEYDVALEEYSQIIAANPDDTLAYSEFAKISCETLNDPATAREVLEEALGREWAPEDAAFLSFRLVDVYWKYQRDVKSSRALLLQIIETMPGTRHAANAEHRLREIEHQLAVEDTPLARLGGEAVEPAAVDENTEASEPQPKGEADEATGSPG